VNRRIHYPPDQVHVELNRRTFRGEPIPIHYDPLGANPEYLVVGKHSRMWKLYDEVLASGAFRYRLRIGRYDVYERVR
jgi:hypothetical protein